MRRDLVSNLTKSSVNFGVSLIHVYRSSASLCYTSLWLSEIINHKSSIQFNETGVNLLRMGSVSYWLAVAWLAMAWLAAFSITSDEFVNLQSVIFLKNEFKNLWLIQLVSRYCGRCVPRLSASYFAVSGTGCFWFIIQIYSESNDAPLSYSTSIQFNSVYKNPRFLLMELVNI